MLNSSASIVGPRLLNRVRLVDALAAPPRRAENGPRIVVALLKAVAIKQSLVVYARGIYISATGMVVNMLRVLRAMTVAPLTPYTLPGRELKIDAITIIMFSSTIMVAVA